MTYYEDPGLIRVLDILTRYHDGMTERPAIKFHELPRQHETIGEKFFL